MLTLEYVIPGDLENPLFFSASDIVVGQTGTVAISDFQGFRVVLFDSLGTWIASVGSQGQGPGEFGNIVGLERFLDGFVVFDSKNSRFTTIGPTGEITGTAGVPPFLGLISFAAIGSRGGALVHNPLGSDDSSMYWTNDLLAGWPGEWQSTEMDRLVPDLGVERNVGLAVGSGRDEGFFVGRQSGEYVLTLVGPNGSILRRVVRDILATPKSQAEIDGARESFVQMFGEDAAERLDKPRFKVQPHFSEFGLDPLGRLWVLTGRGGKDEGIIDVFTPDGELLAEHTIPGHISKFDVSQTQLYVLAVNDSGLMDIRAYRLN